MRRSLTLHALGGCLVVACLAFSTEISALSDWPKRIVLQAGVALAGVLGLIARPQSTVVPPRWIEGGVVALALGAGLAWLRAEDGYRATETLTHWMVCGVAAAIALQVVSTAGGARALLRWVGVAGLAVAVVGLLQFYGAIAWAPEAAPPASTFGNRNWASQALAPCMPIFAALGLVAGRRSERWLWWGALALGGAMLLKIASSAAFGAVGWGAVVLAVYGFTVPSVRRLVGEAVRRERRGIAAAAVLLAAAGVAGGMFVSGSTIARSGSAMFDSPS